MKKLEIIIVSSIVLLALILRLYKIDRPLADWHSWRQADTAAVSRNFIKEGFTPFVPKFDDMSKQANGLDNPNRYRFVEFPIYNALIALVWKFTGVSMMYARLTTVFVTLFSTVFVFLIVRKFSSLLTASLAAFFFATIPYNIFYSSTILPAPFMVFSVLGLYLFFIKYLDGEKLIFLALSIIFANMALLSWPVAAFFFLPVLYLAADKYKLGIFKNTKLWLFALASVAPLLAWRIWILNFPSGIPNWRFLINEGNIRFKGAFFRWIFAERLGSLILTFGGVPMFILGVVLKQGREKLFYYSILLSCILYISVFASGNVRHDYYQIPLIPALSIFMAKGASTLLNLKSQTFNKYAGTATVGLLTLFMFAFGYYQVRGYYWINRPQIVEAGEAVDRLLPKDATVIAPYNGDAAFLYQTNRHGYPITDRPLEEFVSHGTKYLVSVEPNDAGIKNLSEKCKVLEQTENYVIIEMSLECLSK